jgi:hypothetical protein
MPLIDLVPKPPIGNTRSERLKITLAGNHTMRQKACMFMQVKFWLLHEQGIPNAGAIDFYIPLFDPEGRAVTILRNGQAVSGYDVRMNDPYHSAADEYDRRQPAPAFHPF